MRRRVGIYCASDEALSLIPFLAENPELELVYVYDPDADSVFNRLAQFEPGTAALLEQTLTHDAHAFDLPGIVDTVIDGSPDAAFAANPPTQDIQVVTPLTARVLWGGSVPAPNPKTELLQALHEVLQSYTLAMDTDELFTRMLEIALRETGAEQGSLMLLDETDETLRVCVAAGIEPELWPKIRVALGDGIAGRVAREGRPLRLRGKADRARFQIVRERLDVESALCVPLFHDDRVIGVLNLHHRSRADAFDETHFQFAQDLARVDAQIIVRAQEQDRVRRQAARYTAAREVQRIMATEAPLPDRLRALCDFVAEEAGHGITHLYLHDPDDDALHLAATSLAPPTQVGDACVRMGSGIDGRAAETGEPIILRGDDGALAYAALPLATRGVLTGLLSVQVGDSDRAPLTDERISEICNEAAHEISRAERDIRLQERARKVAAIHDEGLKIVVASTLDQRLQRAATAAARVLEANHVVVRQSEDASRFTIRAYCGAAVDAQRDALFALDRDVTGTTLRADAPLLVRAPETHEFLSAHDVPGGSLLAAPLHCGSALVGSIAIYGKRPLASMRSRRFGGEDLVVFGTLVSMVERALRHAPGAGEPAIPTHFDRETKLPNSYYLEQRLVQEVSRSHAGNDSLTIVVVTIEDIEALTKQNPAFTQRIIERTVASLRSRSRGFDVVGRLSHGEFALLLPEPGPAPSERVAELARAVADDVTKDQNPNDPLRISLAFGYATQPLDGSDAHALLARARKKRIEMV